MNVAESFQRLWKRWTERLGCGRWGAQRRSADSRKTVALPSILGPYRPPSNLLPKPTPVNLRRFAETPVVRRAINVIKDRIASLDWQIKLQARLHAGYRPRRRRSAPRCCAALEEPNNGDSFRTLIEQVLEDALVGGFGAIEMELTGDPQNPFDLWPVDGATIRIDAQWDGSPETGDPATAQATGQAGPRDAVIPLLDDELIYLRHEPAHPHALWPRPAGGCLRDASTAFWRASLRRQAGQQLGGAVRAVAERDHARRSMSA